MAFRNTKNAFAVMKIRSELLKEATQCERCFSCLEDTKLTCKVINSINNNVLFIECTNDSICSYLMPFGNSQICNCPVRREIYSKYGV